MSVGLQTLAGHRGPVGCSISPAGSRSWGSPGRSRGGRAQDRGKGSLHAEIHAQGWSYPNTTRTEAIPVLSSPGHHPRGVGRAGIGIHPSSQCHGAALCVPFPVWNRTGGFKLSPLGLPPLIPAAFLGPVAELCLVQALYLLSFSMHTSGALLRHKINKMTVPR